MQTFSIELLSTRSGGAFVFRSSDELEARAEFERACAKPGAHYRARLWRTGGPLGPTCLEDRSLSPDR